METNWKKAHAELVTVSDKRYQCIQDRDALLAEALYGGLELVTQLPGPYEGGRLVYRSRKSGRVVVVSCRGMNVWHHDTLQGLCDFFEFNQSDRAHNVESVRILKEKLAAAQVHMLSGGAQ